MKPLKELLNGEELQHPIEIEKREITGLKRKGANGKDYIEKEYSVYRGSQRVNAAIHLGYDAIEGIIINE